MDKYTTAIIILIIGTLSVISIDIIFSKFEYDTGTILDKQYKGKTVSNGVGTGINSNGSITTINTIEYESEKFLIIIKSKEGNIITAESDPKIYYSKDTNDTIKYKVYRGYFTNFQYQIKVTY